MTSCDMLLDLSKGVDSSLKASQPCAAELSSWVEVCAQIDRTWRFPVLLNIHLIYGIAREGDFCENSHCFFCHASKMPPPLSLQLV